jgi:hypothetical protein
MSQILHIFKKDTRRFWPEILVSSAILFAFVWVFPERWKVHHDQSQFFRAQQFLAYLSVLWPVGWALLVARVVQAEATVGADQFWVTRPYDWKKLLVAKVLFIAVWLGGTYLLAESWLLTVAGFHPLAYIPGLLSGLLVVLVVWALPVLAVATVTSTFARLALTLVGGFVAFLGYRFWSSAPREYVASQPYGDKALPVLLIAGCAAAIVLQYAMRRVWIARAILLAVPVLMAISVIWYSRASLVDLAYSQNAVGASEWMSLSFAPTQSHPASVAYWEGEDHIYLPVHYAGVADGTAIVRDDMKFTITAADGRRWSSPWQAESEYIVPDLDGGTVQLKIRPEVYSRFKSGPVTLQVTFAVSRYQADSVTEIPYPAADAAVPGVGFCTPQSYGLPNLHCRAAIDVPRLTYISAMWSKSGCSNPAHLFEPTAKGRAWTGPAGFDTRLSVVVAQNFWMDYRPTDEEQRQHLPWQICPGSPLTLTTYRSLGSGQVDLTIPNFVLPANVVATD